MNKLVLLPFLLGLLSSYLWVVWPAEANSKKAPIHQMQEQQQPRGFVIFGRLP